MQRCWLTLGKSATMSTEVHPRLRVSSFASFWCWFIAIPCFLMLLKELTAGVRFTFRYGDQAEPSRVQVVILLARFVFYNIVE